MGPKNGQTGKKNIKYNISKFKNGYWIFITCMTIYNIFLIRVTYKFQFVKRYKQINFDRFSLKVMYIECNRVRSINANFTMFIDDEISIFAISVYSINCTWTIHVIKIIYFRKLYNGEKDKVLLLIYTLFTGGVYFLFSVLVINIYDNPISFNANLMYVRGVWEEG